MKLEQIKEINSEQLLVFENARIIDPAQDIDSMGSLIVQNGKILALALDKDANNFPKAGASIIDVAGKIICPGLVHLQTYLPELSAKAVANLSSQASAAGITTMVIVPHLPQIIDNVALLEWLSYSAQKHSTVKIIPAAALTKSSQGLEMTDYGLLKCSGAAALSDGENTVSNSAILRQLMIYAKDFDLPILHRPQDKDLAIFAGYPAAANEGALASWLGLSAACCEAETIGLERDLRLATLTGARYHALNLSCAMSCQALERAKADNPRISASVSIAHLSFNENDIADFSMRYKYTPPLRSEEDRQSLIAALANSQIDAIVCSPNQLTNYNTPEPFAQAPVYGNNLQSLLPLALRLYHANSLSLFTILASLSCNPARIIGIQAGSLEADKPADFIIIDTEEPWKLDGLVLQGKVKATFVDGAMVYNDA